MFDMSNNPFNMFNEMFNNTSETNESSTNNNEYAIPDKEELFSHINKLINGNICCHIPTLSTFILNTASVIQDNM